VTAIDGTTANTATSYSSLQMGTGVATDKSSLGTQDFLNLLVKQLQYQDPSSPADSSQIMQQSATLSSVESMNGLTKIIQSQYAMQQRQTAASYVGEKVTYTDAAGKAATGTVSGASFAGSTPTLTIGSTTVDLDDVNGITAPAASTAPATTPAPTTSS
jgi:flagellar basal-body rod modification protein FlgD